MSKDALKLKPCPFCGGEAQLDEIQEAAEYSPGIYYCGYAVCCMNCIARVSAYEDYDEPHDPAKRKAEAVAAWNLRVARP
jgi:Lar family restriction alleviation protein